MSVELATGRVVTINDKIYAYACPWAGQTVIPKDLYLAFDTETGIVDLKKQIPPLAMAAASAGDRGSCLIRPDDVGSFILKHRQLHFICHNASFDFWVVASHLRARGEQSALQAWWNIADKNRLHDSMLLDMLVRLAQDDSFPRRRDLGTVAQEYAGVSVDKEDPFRRRYGETIGRDWSVIDDGFFDYAIKDAIVTGLAYRRIRKRALELAKGFVSGYKDIRQDAQQTFGLLTEAVQVKKAIALDQVTRNGMEVDLDWIRKQETELRNEISQAAANVQQIRPIYKVDQNGEILTSGTSNTPAVDQKALGKHLAEIKADIEKNFGTRVTIPTTTKGPSQSVKAWQEYAHLDPFLEHWAKERGLSKLAQFFTQFDDLVDLEALASALGCGLDKLAEALGIKSEPVAGSKLAMKALTKKAVQRRQKLAQISVTPEQLLTSSQQLVEANRQSSRLVHPAYNSMVRTGRTGCSSPNIQQVPRDSAYRQAFQAPPGYLMLISDYSYIELRTLAATTLHRYGTSKMAEVIKAGTDPHANTGAMMLNVPLDEFLTWKESTAISKVVENGQEKEVVQKEQFERARQSAKAINFGVPGGLGVDSLVAYARATFKVELSSEEASARRDLLTNTVYPELNDYLAEDSVALVARNLDAPIWEVRNELTDTRLSCVSKILTGDPKKKDGKPYQATYVSRVWSSLAGLNRNPGLKDALDKRTPSQELAAKVCQAGVSTLTGRIRGHVRYSQARNTPFQGLAADGAALAMFELIKQEFRVVGFIHDEILTLLPDKGGYADEAEVTRVKEIMCRKMEEVLVGNIPVDCELALSRRWNKKAKLIVQDGKAFPSDE